MSERCAIFVCITELDPEKAHSCILAPNGGKIHGAKFGGIRVLTTTHWKYRSQQCVTNTWQTSVVRLRLTYVVSFWGSACTHAWLRSFPCVVGKEPNTPKFCPMSNQVQDGGAIVRGCSDVSAPIAGPNELMLRDELAARVHLLRLILWFSYLQAFCAVRTARSAARLHAFLSSLTIKFWQRL